MSPRTDEQFEIIREERKKQIMQVALELIAADGFQKVSIAKIASKAKISKGLMYNYFASKEDLIQEIMNDGLSEFTKYFDPNRDGELTKDELHFFIDKMFDVLQENIRFWRMYFMAMFQPDVFKLIEAKMMEIIGFFMKIAMEYFVKNDYENPEVELRIFSALLDGVALHFVLDPHNFPLEGVKKKMHDMYK